MYRCTVSVSGTCNATQVVEGFGVWLGVGLGVRFGVSQGEAGSEGEEEEEREELHGSTEVGLGLKWWRNGLLL